MLVLFFVAAWLAVAAQAQEAIRTLEKVSLKNEPVAITEIRVGNNSGISLGQSFIANKDWVSDLTFKVKNVSAKPIARVELELQFPEVKINKGALVTSIQYGQVPDLPEPGQEKPPVAPNETIQLQLDSDTYGGLKGMLNANERPLGVTKVRVRLSTIIFVDGTAWHNGYLHTRDPNNPMKWIRIGNNIGMIKTPSRTVGFFVSGIIGHPLEFVFAPEERDVYSYERAPKDLAPLGAKPGSGTFAGAGKTDCAPPELRSKGPPGYRHLAPLGRSYK
jgi:hypothetical protein